MAQQNSGFQPATHFWEHDACLSSIAAVYHQGPTYQYEASVWHMWDAICHVYFPMDTPDDQPHFTIIREAYRGPIDKPHEHRPDVTVVQVRLVFPIPFQPSAFYRRDFLWVECKAADKDTPGGWKTLIGEVVTRLNSAHPDREVFVIFAIGLKWIYLAWDPANTILAQAPLLVRGLNGVHWQLDSRLKAITSPYAAAAPWVRANGEIDPSWAASLDCWTPLLLPNGLIAGRSNWVALQHLETFLHWLRDTPLLL